MPAKRALVVDDSRSARAFLTRLLEGYELQVDGVESAEEAIAYLTRQRPDVVFMDHLMPGMDGFQAVQAIKGDPRTATIPILMYTSQEGELYVSQARALGAVGVLSKQVKTTDVSRVLEQLRLLGPARADSEPIAPPPPAEAGVGAVEASAPKDGDRTRREMRIRVLVEPLLDEQLREVRRLLSDQLERQTERMAGDVRAMLQDGRLLSPPPVGRPGRSLPLWLVAAAIVIAVGSGLLLNDALQDARSLEKQLAASQLQLASAAARVEALEAQNAVLAAPAAPGPAPAPAVPAPSQPPPTARVESLPETGLQIDTVPFGEPPFALARVERIQALLDRLLAQGFHGTVQIRSFPGRYCLVGGEQMGIPAADTAFVQCTALGNPLEGVAASERESAAFAGMIAATRRRGGAGFAVQVSDGSGEETSVEYPTVTEQLTAGEWNRAAAANNRVEVRWRAQSKG
jgi:CheY-like chemotaxis protein